MPHQKELEKLAKFLTYVLGRQPDEFGLIPDSEGFVRIKELLKAVHEEAAWRYLRWSHLNELSMMLPSPPVEIQDQTIRSVNRQSLPTPMPTGAMPKIIYTCIRRKAQPVVMQRGLTPGQGPWIILSSDREMALRLGRRYDAEPVVLTVNTLQSSQAKVEFLRFGEVLYLAARIPVGCFTGPPLPKERPEKSPSKDTARPANTITPGSFFIDWGDQQEPNRAGKSKSGKKEIRWKEERRRGRRKKTGDWL